MTPENKTPELTLLTIQAFVIWEVRGGGTAVVSLLGGRGKAGR